MTSSQRYLVQGGRPVSGRIRCLGAKNFATKAMVAALLAEGTTRLLNAPRIGDVEITRKLLAASGAKLDWSGAKLEFTNVKAANQHLRRTYRKGWEVAGL